MTTSRLAVFFVFSLCLMHVGLYRLLTKMKLKQQTNRRPTEKAASPLCIVSASGEQNGNPCGLRHVCDTAWANGCGAGVTSRTDGKSLDSRSTVSRLSFLFAWTTLFSMRSIRSLRKILGNARTGIEHDFSLWVTVLLQRYTRQLPSARVHSYIFLYFRHPNQRQHHLSYYFVQWLEA